MSALAARARRRRQGYAVFIALSIALHASLAALPASAPPWKIPSSGAVSGVAARVRAGEAASGVAARVRAVEAADIRGADAADAGRTASARFRGAVRGSFVVVRLDLDAAVAPELPRSERTAGEERTFLETETAHSSGSAGGTQEALEEAVLSSAAGEGAPRSRGAGSDERGRLVPPVPIALAWPEYPGSARAGRSGGSVLLRVHVTAFGAVDSVVVVKPLPDEALNAAAEAAARRLRFEPARIDGRPVAVWFSYPVTFTPERDARSGTR